MKYNRADIKDTMRAAVELQGRCGRSLFVYATGCGYLISRNPPAFRQAYFIVSVDGGVYNVSENGSVGQRQPEIQKDLELIFSYPGQMKLF